MEKKKAIKIVTATAIAASAFTAVAPAQSEAASSLDKQISATKAAMKKPYDKYVKATSLASIKTIESYIKSAKTAETNAIKAINKTKLSKSAKSKKIADVKKYEVYINRAQGYVDAYKAATADRNALQTQLAELEATVATKDVEKITAQYNELLDAIKAAKKAIKDTVYGAKIETLLYNKFTAPTEAKLAEGVEKVLAELKAQQEAKANADAYVALANGDLKTQEKIDAAKAAKAKIDLTKLNDTDKAAVEAADKKVADAEAALKAVSFKEVNATGSKTLTVTFNKTVDTTKAVFEVKKGTVKVNTSAVTWNADKTTAAVELTGKLTAGDYTVNVSGLTTDALSKTIAVQDEKVAKIEILSTDAPLVDSTSDNNSDVTDIQVGYRVLNQYGEDITKTTTLTTSSSNVKVNQADGTVTVEGTFNTTTNKTAIITLIHAESATTATATLTAVSEAKASEVTVKGLYNKDGKALTETTKLTTDKFYAELEVKDQYGKVITNAAKLTSSDIIINGSNPNVVTVASTVSVVDVNGTKKVLVELSGNPTVGETIVTAITTASGKSSSYKVTVGESTRAYNVDIASPELPVANEEVLIPVNVTDKEGNLITDLSVLKDATRGIKITIGGGSNLVGDLIVKNGAVYLPQTFSTDGYQSIVLISNANQKVDTLTLAVKAAAKPVIITGVDADWNKAITSGDTITLAPENLTVEDQYGRVLSATAFKGTLGTASGKYQVKVTETTDVVNISGDATLNSASDTVSIAGTSEGIGKVSLQLADNTGALIAGTQFEFNIEVTSGTAFKSYEFATIGKIYDEAGSSATTNDSVDVKYDKNVVVYGVLDSGKKIELAPSQYSVIAPSFLDYNYAGGSGTDKLELNTDATTAGAVPYAKDTKEYTAKVDVVINATGQKLSQDVVISKEAPKATDFKLVNVAPGTLTTQTALQKAVAISGTIDLANTETAFDNADLTSDRTLVVLDSYGVYHKATDVLNFAGSDSLVTSNVALTIKKVTDYTTSPDAAFVITGNGTKNATIASGLDLNDEFDLVISIDGVEKTFRIKK